MVESGCRVQIVLTAKTWCILDLLAKVRGCTIPTYIVQHILFDAVRARVQELALQPDSVLDQIGLKRVDGQIELMSKDEQAASLNRLLGGPEAGSPARTGEPEKKRPGAPKKITPYLEKYINLGVRTEITHPRDSVLIAMFEPVQGTGSRQELNLYALALMWLKGDAGFDGTLLQSTWGTFVKTRLDDYPNWRDDPSGALACFANVLYAHANPE